MRIFTAVFVKTRYVAIETPSPGVELSQGRDSELYVKRRTGYDCTSVYFPDNPPKPVNPEPNPQPAPPGSKRNLQPNKVEFKRQFDGDEIAQASDNEDGDECAPRPRRGGGGDGRPRQAQSCSPEFLRSLGEQPDDSQPNDSC